MAEKDIRDRMCHVVQIYSKTSNKYMKDYDPNTESPYLMYWDGNNLYE